jgi:hypothetical protein
MRFCRKERLKAYRCSIKYKKDKLTNTIHSIIDGEDSQKYEINSDLSVNCDYTSNLYKALGGTVEEFTKVLDSLQESVTKDGIEFDINKVSINNKNIISTFIKSQFSEKHKIIKVLKDRGASFEDGIAEYLQEKNQNG